MSNLKVFVSVVMFGLMVNAAVANPPDFNGRRPVSEVTKIKIKGR